MRKFLPAVVGVFLLSVAVMALAGPASAAPVVGAALAPFTPRRQISVNQSGYYSHAPKVAVLVSDSRTPLAWALKDGSGQTVLAGETVVKGPDAASGDADLRRLSSAEKVCGRLSLRDAVRMNA